MIKFLTVKICFRHTVSTQRIRCVEALVWTCPFPVCSQSCPNTDLHASVNVPCTYRSQAVRSHVGSGLYTHIVKDLLFQATPLLYTFPKPFQVCFEVSTQSAGERRRGGGEGGAVWTARHGRHPPSPRSIALKFSRKSSPICPNTSGCQRSKTCNNCYNCAVLFQFQGLK